MYERNASIKNKLDEEILVLIDDIMMNQTGTAEEREKAIKQLRELNEIYVDNEKLELEKYNSEQTRMIEEEKKELQIKTAQKERIIRIIIASIELAIPLIFYNSWMRKGMKFEETGTFTSSTFKGFLNKLKPTKI